MRNIRKDMDVWSKIKYSEQLQKNVDSGRFSDPEAIKLLRSVLNYQNINDVTMNGNSIQKLALCENEGNVHYVDIFDACYSKATNEPGSWSPIDMMYEVCCQSLHNVSMQNFLSNVIESNYADGQAITQETAVALVCGRAMRGFPSYLREMDLISQLEQNLPENAQLRSDRDLDQNAHADLLISYKDHEGTTIDNFYGWSFVSTKNAIAKFEDKFYERKVMRDRSTGQVGTIHVPQGHHILFPCDLDRGDDFHGWKLYNSNELHRFINDLNKFVSAEVLLAVHGEEGIEQFKQDVIKERKEIADKIRVCGEQKNVLQGKLNGTVGYDRTWGQATTQFKKFDRDTKKYDKWQKRFPKLPTSAEILNKEQEDQTNKLKWQQGIKDIDTEIEKLQSADKQLNELLDSAYFGLSLERNDVEYGGICLTSKGTDITDKVIQRYRMEFSREIQTEVDFERNLD